MSRLAYFNFTMQNSLWITIEVHTVQKLGLQECVLIPTVKRYIE